MILKRRNKLSIPQALLGLIYPRGGWSRALQYVKLRIRRLPDTPEKISRGIAAGVFVCFTPFFGFHFILAALMARLTRGNIFAALMGTFFGNPLTFIPIAIASLYLSYHMLGRPLDETLLFGSPQNGMCGITCQFGSAIKEFWANVWALIWFEPFDFSNIIAFWDDVILPYCIGGVFLGSVAWVITYYICVRLLRTYQKHNRKALQKKLAHLSTPPINKL